LELSLGLSWLLAFAFALATNHRSSELPPRFNLAIIKHFNRWKIFAILLQQAPAVRPVS